MVLIIHKYHLTKIAAIHESPHEMTVTLSDGHSAVLNPADPEEDQFVRYLRLAHEGQELIAVAVDNEGRIWDAAGVERDGVWGVEEPATMPTAAAVWFWRQNGLLGLMKEHPHYRELVTLLQTAATGQQPVWYITRSGCVLDVLQLSPEEDAALSRSFGQ